MQLNNEQVDKILNFLITCDVKYIDIRHELVDHFASEIEDKMTKHPKLYFDEHLQNMYMNYLPEIKKIVWSKEQVISRYWRSKFWKYFKSYFVSPKLFTTLFLFLAIFLGTIYIGRNVLIVSYIIATLVSLVTLVKSHNRFGISNWKSSEYFVLRIIHNKISSILITTVCFCPAYISLINGTHSTLHQGWPLFPFTLALVCILIWNHACLTEFPKIIKQELNSIHPYLNLAN